MNDFDDDLINDAFGGFTAAAASSVRPMGAEAARSTVKRRRKARASALGLLAALLIVAPVAAYATIDRESQGPPLHPGGTLTVEPSVAMSPSTVPSGPDGRISIEQLRAGKITLPAWDPIVKNPDAADCKDGLITLDANHDGGSDIETVVAKQVVHLNLDADPAQETAALVDCLIGQVSWSQVVVFDRDEAGTIVTVGQIIRSGEAMNGIWYIDVDSAGRLKIDVSDAIACCGESPAIERHQTRSFAWTGSNVAQVDGPTSFPPRG